MKRLHAIAAVLTLLAFGGAVDSADAGVKVRYFKGSPTYISTMPASAVEVAVPEQRKGKRVWVGIVALPEGFNKPPHWIYRPGLAIRSQSRPGATR